MDDRLDDIQVFNDFSEVLLNLLHCRLQVIAIKDAIGLLLRVSLDISSLDFTHLPSQFIAQAHTNGLECQYQQAKVKGRETLRVIVALV